MQARPYIGYGWRALALVACVGCGGSEQASRMDTLKASLKGASPLSDHVSGPVVAWYIDDGVGYTLCADAATKQAPVWEKEFRAGIFYCRSDEETPPLVLCTSVADQRAIALAFDETTSRLVGMARGPAGAAPAYQAWFAKLRGETAACTSAVR